MQWTLETDAIAWLRFLAWATLAPPTGKRHSAICSKSRELAVLKTARRKRQKIPDMFQLASTFASQENHLIQVLNVEFLEEPSEDQKT